MTENLFSKDSRGRKNGRESFEKRFSDVMCGTVDFVESVYKYKYY
jgi:hypothetical protein